MATYAELYDLRSDSALVNRVSVAVTKKAAAILALASPSAAQVAWADAALERPNREAEKLMGYVLAAAPGGATKAQIASSADADVLTSVGVAVDKLIAGGVA